jgi:hypothetical protein
MLIRICFARQVFSYGFFSSLTQIKNDFKTCNTSMNKQSYKIYNGLHDLKKKPILATTHKKWKINFFLTSIYTPARILCKVYFLFISQRFTCSNFIKYLPYRISLLHDFTLTFNLMAFDIISLS